MATALLFANQFIVTTLNVGGGITNSQTTGIIIASPTGIDITKPGIALLNYADPLVTSTCEWIEYTSINGSNELQGVVRGSEGYSAKSHNNGVQVAFPVSESHINRLATALSIGGVATNGVEGTLDEDDMASNSATKLATQQSIKAYVDAKASSLGDVDNAGGSSTTSSTYANITGADVSVTTTAATSNILLSAVVQCYANPGAITGSVDYQVQFHDGTNGIGQPMGVSFAVGNQRQTLSITHLITGVTAGVRAYTLQHKSTNNVLSCTAEQINFNVLAMSS